MSVGTRPENPGKRRRRRNKFQALIKVALGIHAVLACARDVRGIMTFALRLGAVDEPEHRVVEAHVA